MDSICGESEVRSAAPGAHWQERGVQPREAGRSRGTTQKIRRCMHTTQAKSETRKGTREPQTDVEQQGWETSPHKPGPPAGLGEGLAWALEVGGPGHRSQGPRPAERGGRAVKAPPGRTPAVGARRTSAAGSEEPEAATAVGHRRDAPRPVHRASESRRWRPLAGSSEQPAIASAICRGMSGNFNHVETPEMYYTSKQKCKKQQIDLSRPYRHDDNKYCLPKRLLIHRDVFELIARYCSANSTRRSCSGGEGQNLIDREFIIAQK